MFFAPPSFLRYYPLAGESRGRPFTRLIDMLLTLLFNLLSLFYVYRGLRLAYDIWRDRERLGAEPLTHEQKRVVEEAAFFLAIPPGVAVHELGHAVAVWLFGGEVVEFGYRVFWGFVLPRGTFTLAQEWWISVAGTIGTLLYGLALWGWARSRRASSLRFFGLRALRLHIFYALIYYPVFSAMGLFGDWVTIYNFRATPLLSGVTAVIHAGILLFYWQLSRRGFFEMPAPDTLPMQENLRRLQSEAQANPQDLAIQLRLVQTLMQMGAPQQAARFLDDLLQQHPHFAPGWLEQAVLQAQGKRTIPRQAADSAEKALRLGLPDAAGVRRAHHLLGARYLDMGKLPEAARHLDQAIAALESNSGLEPAPHFHRLYQMRAVARRQLGQHQAAYQDIETAIRQAKLLGEAQTVENYAQLRQAIAQNAGITPDSRI